MEFFLVIQTGKLWGNLWLLCSSPPLFLLNPIHTYNFWLLLSPLAQKKKKKKWSTLFFFFQVCVCVCFFLKWLRLNPIHTYSFWFMTSPWVKREWIEFLFLLVNIFSPFEYFFEVNATLYKYILNYHKLFNWNCFSKII